jgi:hypothetical protein
MLNEQLEAKPGGTLPDVKLEKWKFKCQCEEVCSWYEKAIYHPKGKMYECSNCGIWSHVVCIFGNELSDEELAILPVHILCYFYTLC